MSWEAWGTPPDQEPERCPICDNTQHTPDQCEIAASEEHSRKHYEGVIALLLQDRERRLTDAYAEGRKDQSEEDAEMLRRVTQALGDLSFECFGGIGVGAPSIETYNRTFGVLEEARAALAAPAA